MAWLGDLERIRRQEERREAEEKRRKECVLAEQKRLQAEEYAKEQAIRDQLVVSYHKSPAPAVISRFLKEMERKLGMEARGQSTNLYLGPRSETRYETVYSKWHVTVKKGTYYFHVEHLHPALPTGSAMSIAELRGLLRQKEFVVVRYGGEGTVITAHARKQEKIEVGTRSWERELEQALIRAYQNPFYWQVSTDVERRYRT